MATSSRAGPARRSAPRQPENATRSHASLKATPMRGVKPAREQTARASEARAQAQGGQRGLNGMHRERASLGALRGAPSARDRSQPNSMLGANPTKSLTPPPRGHAPQARP